MKYKLGDRVCIVEKQQIGYICDARFVDGLNLYTVDCSSECDSEDARDCVITVKENEIEFI